MDLTSKKLYVASIVYGDALMPAIRADNRVKIDSVELKTTRLTGTWIWEVPELEDEEVANKIELLYADLPVTKRYWQKMPNLKWAHTAWNGVDEMIYSLKKDGPLPEFMLTKTDGAVNAPLITEYIIGHIIATERCFFEAMDAQKSKEWRQMIFSKSRTVTNITVGILGVGGIGRYLARACKALGMTVWGLTRKPRPELEDDDVDVYSVLLSTGKTKQLPFGNMVSHCKVGDIEVNAMQGVPSTDKTKHLLCGDMMSHCKESVFINVGRGDVVDEKSLVTALKNGWLRGAVLDVFEKEPLPASSPLWRMPGVVITPHISGSSTGEKHMKKVNECFFTNFERYIDGQPLVGVLDWNQGY